MKQMQGAVTTRHSRTKNSLTLRQRVLPRGKPTDTISAIA